MSSQISSSSGSLISEKNKNNFTNLKSESLHSIRFPSRNGSKERKKTHLLSGMSEFIDAQEEIKIEDIQQFCSFDRIKKIIEKQNGAELKNQFQNGQNFLHQPPTNNDMGKQMMGVMKIQVKMKRMQENLNKNELALNIMNEKQKRNTHKNNQYLKNIRPFLRSQNASLHVGGQELKKQKKVIFEKQNRQVKQNFKLHHHLIGQQTIKKEFLKNAYQIFNQWEKKKKVDNQTSVKNFIEQQIVKKVYSILEERDIKYNELLKQNKIKEKVILEKSLEIENLKLKEKNLQQNIQELQIYREKYSEECMRKKQDREEFLEEFYQEFSETFPMENVKSLKILVDNIIGKCLGKFQDIELKNVEKWNLEKKEFLETISRLEGNISKMRDIQYELRNTLKSIRDEQHASTMEIDSLLKSKQDLEKLQNKILEVYNQWFSKRSEQEKQVMHSLGFMKGSYEYIEMLSYISVYREKLSTDHKVHQYLIKVMRGIERIRKILYPSNGEVFDEQRKKDPLVFIDKLEKYIKNKVYQTRYRKQTHKLTNNQNILDEHFLASTVNDDL